MESLLDKYSPWSELSDCKKASSATVSSRLGFIPLEAWENETPVLDAIIRETTRLAQPHVAMRRNLGPDLVINNKVIPTDSYVIYPFSDVHLDPEIYLDPWRFDPSRKETNPAKLEYVGWGGGKKLPQSANADFLCSGNIGRTTCLGTRLAKVELKLVTAMFVLSFLHSVVDPSGAPMTNLPRPNWNDFLLCRPAANSFYLKYKRTGVTI